MVAQLAIAVIWLLASHLIPVAAPHSGCPITIGEPTVINEFPTRFVVQFPLRCSAGEIVAVRALIRYGSEPSRQRINLAFTPGRETVATWEWDTSRITVPPYVPVEIQLKIGDSEGNWLVTEPFHFVYEDNRFTWHELASEHLRVRWYAGSDAFGRAIFDLAESSLHRQMQALGITPEHPIVLMVYATEDDFFAWHSYRTEWVGGQAFPDYGLAAQIIPPDSRPAWIYNVIPHEINHLLVSPYARNAFGDTPPWVQEGLAQHFEESPPDEEQRILAKAVRDGYLLPLGVMRSPPGQKEEEARLWYAQALSMVEWLLVRHGEARLQTYLRLIHEGTFPSHAFHEAFGESEREFYASWREHLGLPVPTPSPTPTATLTPTITPSPSATPTARPVPTHVPPQAGVGTVGPTPVPPGIGTLATRTPSPTPPSPAPPSNSMSRVILGTICIVAGLALLVFTIVWLVRHHSP